MRKFGNKRYIIDLSVAHDWYFRFSAPPKIYTIFIESTGVIWCFLLFYAILQEGTIMHNSIYEVSRDKVR